MENKETLSNENNNGNNKTDNLGDNTSSNKGIIKKRRWKLSKGKTAAIAVILALYVLVIAAVSVVVFYRPEIESDKRVYVETVTDTHGNVIKQEIVMNRDTSSYNILVLGHDRAARLTDVFMLVNIDNNDHSITIMQIPRDTWIANHTDAEDSSRNISIPTNKINALFSTYYHRDVYQLGVDKAYSKALGLVSKDLEQNLGIEIDYSVIMDLEGFGNIVDILGGVEIYVEQAMYYSDPGQGLYINIPSGYQTLNGAQAEGFVRYRSGYLTADLGRQNAQKQFLAALFAKAKSSLSITNVQQLTDLANEIFSCIYTDMNAADMLYFTQCILQCDLSTMNMMTMPGNLANGYYVMNRAAVRKIINDNYNVYDKELTDGIFDQKQVFNCPDQYNINYAYFLPADNVYDDSVYNGENVEDIYIPRR